MNRDTAGGLGFRVERAHSAAATKGRRGWKRLRIALAAAVLAALTATAAWAAQPGPGTSTGTGKVFFPNPVAQLRNESLTDQKDADYAAVQPAY